MKTKTLETTGILTISSTLQKQIDHYHKNTPKNLEWSGVLMYEITKGDFEKDEKVELNAVHAHICDIGTSGFTNYDAERINYTELHKQYPEFNPFNGSKYRKAMIHSHHSMQAYFSGTDMDELYINCKQHEVYLSLIVNYNGRYTAKLVQYRNVDAQSIAGIELREAEDILVVRELDIKFEQQVDENVVKRFDEILNITKTENEILTTSEITGHEPPVVKEFLNGLAFSILGYPSNTKYLTNLELSVLDYKKDDMQKYFEYHTKEYTKPRKIELLDYIFIYAQSTATFVKYSEYLLNNCEELYEDLNTDNDKIPTTPFTTFN